MLRYVLEFHQKEEATKHKTGSCRVKWLAHLCLIITLLFLDRLFRIQATRRSEVNKGFGSCCESSKIYLFRFQRGRKVKQVCQSLKLFQIRKTQWNKKRKRDNVKKKKPSNLDTFQFSAFIDFTVCKTLRSHLNFGPANIHSPEGQRSYCTTWKIS